MAKVHSMRLYNRKNTCLNILDNILAINNTGNKILTSFVFLVTIGELGTSGSMCDDADTVRFPCTGLLLGGLSYSLGGRAGC